MDGGATQRTQKCGHDNSTAGTGGESWVKLMDDYSISLLPSPPPDRRQCHPACGSFYTLYATTLGAQTALVASSVRNASMWESCIGCPNKRNTGASTSLHRVP